MKKFLLHFCLVLLVVAISACSNNRHIPDSSILDEIPVKELSDVLEKEKEKKVEGFTFEEMYPKIRDIVDNMSDVEKARYAKLTYRELFNAQQAVDDTIQSAKLKEEWKRQYDKLLPQAKVKAKELETEILISYRNAYTKAYLFDDSRISFGSWLKENGYSKYLPTFLYSVNDITEDSWKYPAIIRDFVDPNFTNEGYWITTQRLNSLEDRHPLAVEFLRAQYEKSNTTYEALLNSF